MNSEVLIRLLGENSIFRYQTLSDGHNCYTLQAKYLTRDCSSCEWYIPHAETIQIVEFWGKRAKHKWTAPNPADIQGLCTVGKYPKILETRTKGPRRCQFYEK